MTRSQSKEICSKIDALFLRKGWNREEVDSCAIEDQNLYNRMCEAYNVENMDLDLAIDILAEWEAEIEFEQAT